MTEHSARIATIYADGFGRWFVGVKIRGPIESSGAVIIARRAIRAELVERAPRDAELPRTKVERIPDMDFTIQTTGETVVYYAEGASDMTTHAELQAIADFDHPFTVTDDGTLTDAPSGIYAPDVFHSDSDDIDIMGDDWEALTGYTGQYSYRGAVMHASEYIGGALADDILSTPGTYAVVTVEVMPTVTYPHKWSESGARCVRWEWDESGARTGCRVVGAGPGDGSCESHPDYDAELVADDEDPEPAGWAILRLI